MEKHNGIEDKPKRRVAAKVVVMATVGSTGGIRYTRTRGEQVYRVPHNEINPEKEYGTGRKRKCNKRLKD